MATRNLEDEVASGVIDVLKQYGVLPSHEARSPGTEPTRCVPLSVSCTSALYLETPSVKFGGGRGGVVLSVSTVVFLWLCD